MHTPRHATQRHATPRHATPRRATPRLAKVATEADPIMAQDHHCSSFRGQEWDQAVCQGLTYIDITQSLKAKDLSISGRRPELDRDGGVPGGPWHGGGLGMF